MQGLAACIGIGVLVCAARGGQIQKSLRRRPKFPQMPRMLLFTAREISGVRTLGRVDVRERLKRGLRPKTCADATTLMLPNLKEELGAVGVWVT